MTRGYRLPTLKARRLLAGHSVSRLASLANVSDQTINQLENGGNCDPDVAARILNALGGTVALTGNSAASPTVVTATGHPFQTGDTVLIAGVVDSDADVNGSRVVTRVNADTFTVPVNAAASAGTGGTATLQGASVGQVVL